MIVQRLDENLNMDKVFKCDTCGKELNMGYYSSVYPPKPWSHKEVKQNGFYILKHHCSDCSKENRMYAIEWLGKDEKPGPLGGWIKIVSYSQIAEFCKETIEEGGIVLSIKKAE